MANAAVWFRVSTDDQTSANQVPDIERYVAHHGHTVTRRYEVSDSAWKQGPEYRRILQQALDDARAGHFQIMVIWALDRIIRNGDEGKSAAEQALALVRLFGERGVRLVSIKESWMDASPEIASVLISFAAWTAEQESRRRSERVRAGMARAKAEGKAVGGRKRGSKDRRPRAREGYVREQARRRGERETGGAGEP